MERPGVRPDACHIIAIRCIQVPVELMSPQFRCLSALLRVDIDMFWASFGNTILVIEVDSSTLRLHRPFEKTQKHHHLSLITTAALVPVLPTISSAIDPTNENDHISVWTGDNDGRVCIWSLDPVTRYPIFITSFQLSTGVMTFRYFCLNEFPRGEVWIGLRDGQIIRISDLRDPSGSTHVLQHHTAAVSDIVSANDCLISGCWDEKIAFWTLN